MGRLKQHGHADDYYRTLTGHGNKGGWIDLFGIESVFHISSTQTMFEKCGWSYVLLSAVEFPC